MLTKVNHDPASGAGVGERARMRVEKTKDNDGAPYRGRIIKVIDHARTRLLGIFRALPAGGGRLIPVDKKLAGRELNIAKDDTGGAEDGEYRDDGRGEGGGRCGGEAGLHRAAPSRAAS